ncbi:MAG: helix-turn-helix domain-containing protein [Pseudomonadota bacterium]
MSPFQKNPSNAVYTSAVLSGPICAILGLDWSDVVMEAQLSQPQQVDLGFMVSGEDYIRLWNAMMRMSPQDNVASMLGQRMASGPAIPVLFAMSTAPNLEIGLNRLARYKHLFGPMRFSMSKTSHQFTLRVMPDNPGTTLPESFSSPQIIYVHAKAISMGSRHFTPVQVSLPLPTPEREGLADLFRIVPHYGPPTLTYALSDLSVPFISQNDALWAFTEEDLESQSIILSGDAPLTHRVRATLLEAFGTTNPTLSHVCSRLKSSRSALLRGLNKEGQTFQELLDQTRSDLAAKYLRTSDLSNQQIAHLVGYSDSSAFQRAFRKWTGKTPQEMRRNFQRIEL